MGNGQFRCRFGITPISASASSAASTSGARRRKGDTGENLVELLERRLHCTISHLTFLPTPFAARQFVNHGHVLVNGKRVNIPSYTLRDGDTVELKRKAKQSAIVLEAAKSAERDVPDYLSVDADSSKLTDVPYPVSLEPNLVVEFYSL